MTKISSFPHQRLILREADWSFTLWAWLVIEKMGLFKFGLIAKLESLMRWKWPKYYWVFFFFLIKEKENEMITRRDPYKNIKRCVCKTISLIYVFFLPLRFCIFFNIMKRNFHTFIPFFIQKQNGWNKIFKVSQCLFTLLQDNPKKWEIHWTIKQ